jgi:methyl-accepting chemotaxis protein
MHKISSPVCESEEKINEIIDSVNEFLAMLEEQNAMILRIMDIAKEQKEIIWIQTEKINKMTEYTRQMKEELPEVLRQAVTEQKVDVFQEWLQRKG